MRSIAGDLPCPAHLGGRDCCHQAPLSAAVNCPGEKQCHINKQPQPWSCFGKGWGYWVVKVATFKDYLWFLISKCTSYVPTSHSIFSNKPLLSLRWSCTRREASTPRLRLGVLELWLCILERSQWHACEMSILLHGSPATPSTLPMTGSSGGLMRTAGSRGIGDCFPPLSGWVVGWLAPMRREGGEEAGQRAG